MLESPDYVGTSGTRTLFNIETSSGKSVQPHSYFKHEEEIVLPPGIHFKVVDKFSPSKGLHIIHLREIPPPFKPLTDPFDLSQWKEVLPPPKSSLPSSSTEKKEKKDSSTSAKPTPPVQSSSKKGKFFVSS